MTVYRLSGGLLEGEGEFLSPYKLCTVKYIIYFLQKSISLPECVPLGLGKKFKLQTIAAVHPFPLLGFVFLFVFGLVLMMNWKTYLEKATKTTVYRLKKNTAFILLGSWATILLQISSPLLCFKLVSNVDEGQKSLTLLCLHTEENVQCLFVFPIIFVLFTNFNCSRVAFIFCNHW